MKTLLTLSLFASSTAAFAQEVVPEKPWGHSHLGAHYNEGPRQKPWFMDVGEVDFPITSTHAEAQRWFEQGVALLHGFWPTEAERAFRWVAHLDPDCAIAYWGLAKASWRGDEERRKAFLDQASERRDGASAREQAYIDLAVAQHELDVLDTEDRKQRNDLEDRVRELGDALVMDYPGDLEALAFACLEAYESGEEENRLQVESMVQRILDRDPDHVGALHYRIHNWDGEQGEYAIESCFALSAAAPDCGHLQHMPGHVLSGIGLWHEAAIAQDGATRVEQRYMNRRRVMPEDNWNYMHNLDYLSYVQGQLGMHEMAVHTALQLTLIPLHELPFADNPMFKIMGSPMRIGLQRELIRAEKWEEIAEGRLIGWPEEPSPGERILQQYGLAHAELAQGNTERVGKCLEGMRESVAGILERVSKMPAGAGPSEENMDRMVKMLNQPAREIEALLALHEGNAIEGIQKLTQYAELQAENWVNDPPMAPYYGYNLLGRAFLELGSPVLAAEAFEKTLEQVFHDGTALAGLVQAYHSLGRTTDARSAMARLEVTWSEADAGNALLAAARATGVQPDRGALSENLIAQRPYGQTVLSIQGPCQYQPAPAPALSAIDVEGRKVSLTDFRGRCVLLFFYLGDQCTHCVEQLVAAHERMDRFRELGVEVLAISKDSVEKNKSIQESFDLRLLSDVDFATAKRYGSYDDFEGLELHATVLIDPESRIHYITVGGEPFMDFDFLERSAEDLSEGGVLHDLRRELLGDASSAVR